MADREVVRTSVLAIAAGLSASACGRINFADLGDAGAAGGSDVSSDTTGSPDAVAPRCTNGTFSLPVRVTGLGVPPSLYGPKISGDGMTLYFSRPGNTEEDIYIAARAGETAFSPAVALPGVSTTAASEGTPFVSVDGLTLLFMSDRAGGVGGRDLWLATRETTTDDFTVARNLAELNTTFDEHTASLTADGRTVVFATNRDTAGGIDDVYAATRASPTSAFEPPTLVPELSSPQDDSATFISTDGLAMYFASDRPGSMGCLDIFVATRQSPTDPFSSPVPVTELNSAECEDDPSISADGCEVWFSSTRGGAGYEIYRAARTPSR